MTNELKRLAKRLEKAGYTFKTVELQEGYGCGIGLMVDTNYNGLYPTAETFRQQDEIKKIAKKFTTQSRGFNTAVLIY